MKIKKESKESIGILVVLITFVVSVIIISKIVNAVISGDTPANFTSLVNSSTRTFFNHTDGTINFTYYNSTIGAIQLNLSNYNGTYLSQIFDVGSAQAWNNISWTPGAYYGSEIGRGTGDSNAPVASNGNYPNISINTSGLVALFHFNNESSFGENDSQVRDFSMDINSEKPIQDNATCYTGSTCPLYNFSKIKLGNGSVWFDASTTYFNVSDSNSINFTYPHSITSWIYWTGSSANCRFAPVYSKWNTAGLQGLSLQLDSTCKIRYDSYNGTGVGVVGVTSIQNFSWHFIASTIDANKVVKVYLDGILDKQQTVLTFPGQNGQSGQIGNDRSASGRIWDGIIDELSLWNRSLSSAEILNLYKRGALKLNLSVRSCSASDCSDQTGFAQVATNETKTALNIETNKYFQYQANFLTDNLSFSPELYNVTIHYSPRNDSFTALVNTTDRKLFGFANGTLNFTFFNATIGAIQLNLSNYNGTYLSQIFDAGTTQQWLNISWTPNGYYGSEIGRAFNDSNAPAVSNGNYPNISINTSGLVLLYHFNNESSVGENDSLFVDFSTSANKERTVVKNNGTCSTTCPVYDFNNKKFGNSSLKFDGVDNSVKISNGSVISSGNFSISLWARPSTIAGTKAMFGQGKNGGGGNQIDLDIQSNGKIGYVVDGNNRDSGNNVLVANSWYHIVLTYTGIATLYVNGNFDSNTTRTAVYTNGDARIGSTINSVGADILFFNGFIDEVSVWSRSLSSAEVSQLYKRGALKLNLSVRSCSASDCSDNATNFMNNVTNSTNSNLTIPNNRYIQYQANFLIENLTFSPELYNVTIHYLNVTITPPAPTTTCTCPASGDWSISDGSYCNLTTSCDIGKNFLIIDKGGLIVDTGGSFYGGGCAVKDDQVLAISDSASFACGGT